MIAQSLFDWVPPPMSRGGETYVPEFDEKRLNEQQLVVFRVMKDGRWRTPDEIEAATGINWASASARLRDFRKIECGCQRVERQRVEGAEMRGLFQYRLIVRQYGA